MSRPFAPPDSELARRILASVPYQNRIPAGRLTSRLGITRGSVRGLPELHFYLAPDLDTLPAISLERLAIWIEGVISDPELAREVRSVVGAAGNYVDGCKEVRELIGERLAQARALIDAAPPLTMEVKERIT